MQKTHLRHRLISVVLSILMVLTLMPAALLQASAAEVDVADTAAEAEAAQSDNEFESDPEPIDDSADDAEPAADESVLEFEEADETPVLGARVE